MKQLMIAATLLAFVFATTTADAQSRYRSHKRQYGKMQHSPHHRIQQGVRQGQITPWEARNLRYRHAKLRYHAAGARRDGYMSPSERNRLQHQRRGLNGAIYRNRHNGHNSYR